MPQTNTLAVGVLILLGGLISYPFGDVYTRLFLIVAGALLILSGVARGPGKRAEGDGSPIRSRFYTRSAR